MFRKQLIPLTAPATRSDLESKPKEDPRCRPSLVNSAACITSGSRTLDQALLHGGVPLGSVILVEEHGSTDFASCILKGFAAHGIQESRSNSPAHLVCVGIDQWLRVMPSVAALNSSDAEQKQSESCPMKIAWRYEQKVESKPTKLRPSIYSRDLDFKTTMSPAPQPQEVSYIMGKSLESISEGLISELKRLRRSNSELLIRIVVPNILHPAVYPHICSEPRHFAPFILSLVKTCHEFHASAFVSWSLSLYPRNEILTSLFERLVDGVLELEPFENEDVQGFIHILKLPYIFDSGVMVERRGEYAFKLGRSQFEVSTWSIPVEPELERPDLF